MARHPAEAHTRPQRRAFDMIAMGVAPYCMDATLANLERSGLIRKATSQNMVRDSLGLFIIPIYEVPEHHLTAWVEWHEKNPPDEEKPGDGVPGLYGLFG